MHGAIFPAAVAAALLAATLTPGPAAAQFGRINYPQNDFRWFWGRQGDELQRRGFADFDIRGTDAGFECTLEGSIHPGSRLSTREVRELENELRSSLFFIESAANTMYALDQRRDIDWAELDCVKSVDDASESELHEREQKALERAKRARERRRAREDD